jgi:hypothetical protein
MVTPRGGEGYEKGSGIFSLSIRLAGPLLAGASSLCFALALAPAGARAASIWDWTFAGAQVSGAGTFVTADVAPAPNTSYPIIGITGSITREGVVTPIAALNSNFTSVLQWNGQPDSPILVGPSGGGVFWFSSSPAESYLELYSDSATTIAFTPANQLFFVSDATGVVVYPLSQSRLSPRQAPASVPTPLSLSGALLAFAGSRKLRRRISALRL